jgi:hypothetical protein
MFRNLVAIVIGVITAFVTVMLVDKIGHIVYPPPAGLDFTNPDAIRPYLATLPIGAFLFILASAVVAAFAGTLVGCYLGTANPRLFGAAAGGIILAKTIESFIAIPHPLWLSLATLAGVVLSTLLAMRLAAATTGRDSSDGDPG